MFHLCLLLTYISCFRDSLFTKTAIPYTSDHKPCYCAVCCMSTGNTSWNIKLQPNTFSFIKKLTSYSTRDIQIRSKDSQVKTTSILLYYCLLVVFWLVNLYSLFVEYTKLSVRHIVTCSPSSLPVLDLNIPRTNLFFLTVKDTVSHPRKFRGKSPM